MNVKAFRLCVKPQWALFFSWIVSRSLESDEMTENTKFSFTSPLTGSVVFQYLMTGQFFASVLACI